MNKIILQTNEETLQLKKITIHSTYDFDILSYSNKFLYIPSDITQDLSQKMYNILQCNTSEKTVLIIGPGNGRLEIPILKKLNNIKKIVAVDVNKQCLDNFKKGFNNSSLIDAINISFDDHYNTDKFDIIIAFFVLNFLKDWEEALNKIKNLLNENGYLLISEDLYDICFIDNRFPIDNDLFSNPGRKKFYSLWRHYYFIREMRGYPWKPIISPSNMKKCIEMLEADNQFSNVEEIQQCWVNNKTSLNDWLNEIKDPKIFECLYSLPFNERNIIFEKLVEKFNDNNSLDLKFGHKIYIFKKI